MFFHGSGPEGERAVCDCYVSIGIACLERRPHDVGMAPRPGRTGRRRGLWIT